MCENFRSINTPIITFSFNNSTDGRFSLNSFTASFNDIPQYSVRYAQTIKPEPLKAGAKLKEVNAYNRAMKTFLTNQAKWKAAKYEFTKRGAEFQVWTEKELSDKLHLF